MLLQSLAAVAALFCLPASASVINARQGTGRTTNLLTSEFSIIYHVSVSCVTCSPVTPWYAAFPGQGALPTLSQILNLNATNGTFLPLENIQADILYVVFFSQKCNRNPDVLLLLINQFPSVGMKKPLELFYFFKINDATAFKTALRTNVVSLVTSTRTIISPPSSQPLAMLNIAFSQSGLTTLGITDNLGDSAFAAGQWADATNLKDDTSTWQDPWKGTSIHGVFLIASDQQTYINNLVTTLQGYFGSSITELTSIQGAARPGTEAGHERELVIHLIAVVQSTHLNAPLTSHILDGFVFDML